MPPARSTVQMLLAYAKAIWDALTVGIRSSFVGSPSAAGRPAKAVTTTTATAPPIASTRVFMAKPPSPTGRDGTIIHPMRTLRRVLVGLLILGLVSYGGAIVWLIANETRLVFEAGRAVGRFTPSPPLEEISVPGATGPRQRIWVMRASASAEASADKSASAEASADKPWVFFLHGNAATIASRMNVVHYEHLRALGLNVVAPEYRGFGGLDGVPTEAGIEDDARAAYDAVRERF